MGSSGTHLPFLISVHVQVQKLREHLPCGIQHVPSTSRSASYFIFFPLFFVFLFVDLISSVISAFLFSVFLYFMFSLILSLFSLNFSCLID